jgi:hypothetical protein
MSGRKIAVGCVKWGSRFGPDYVNVLYRAVKAHLGLPHRFVCLTNQPDGLDPSVEVMPVPDIGVPEAEWTKRGCWPKVALFAPGVFDDDETVLYLDLDLMIVGALDPFVGLVGERPVFYTLREWNPPLVRALPLGWRPDRGSQGSVYVWRAGDQRHVYEHFRANVEYVRANFWSDRFYLPKIAVGETYLPYDWCVSFKNACVRPWPVNRVLPPRRPPRSSRILVFHGRPRPIDLMGPPGQRWGSKRRSGTEPVEWVKAYWTGFGGTLPGNAGAAPA